MHEYIIKCSIASKIVHKATHIDTFTSKNTKKHASTKSTSDTHDNSRQYRCYGGAVTKECSLQLMVGRVHLGMRRPLSLILNSRMSS